MRLTRNRVVAAAAVVSVLALPLVLPSASLATEVLIFAIAAMGCNLLLGYTGLLSFGQGIFFGVGAYVASLALLHTGAGLFTSLLLAIGSGGAAAALVGALSIRRRGVYFVMLTLAFSQLFYFIAYTANRVTGGENGLLDVPRPPLAVLGVEISSLASSNAYYGLVGGIFLAVLFGLQRVIRSPFGSALLGIRDNEERAIAIGYDTRAFKVLAFVISGGITALAGALYAISLQFSPISNIEFAMSEHILITTIIGGTGSFFGSVLGAVFMVVVGEMLSEIWPRWMLLLGLLLIGVVIFMRGGLWGGLEAGVRRLRNVPRRELPGAPRQEVSHE
jgi:branched-chain amino acid transport system permease protein